MPVNLGSPVKGACRPAEEVKVILRNRPMGLTIIST